jgi:hypothetical protein
MVESLATVEADLQIVESLATVEADHQVGL